MSQIAAIENAIAQMNPARFQEVMDLILVRKFPNAKVFACVGSQYGKEKTVSGTPDTYIEDDDQVFYVEYSTDISSGVSKIRKDIDKCLEDIVDRKISEKASMVIYANFKISKENQISVVDYAESKGFKCYVYDGQYIARLINSDYKDIALECGIHIDTGQVIGIEKFLKEYANKGGKFAISLSTKFMHRTDELNLIVNHLRMNDIVLISGAPGVGKSRISVEAVKDFCSSENYFSKCITYKEESLLSDLNSNLIDGRNYIILVDDVNRVKHIGQILEFQNSYLGGHLKLILTVRNHAKNEILDILSNNSFEVIDIADMSNDNIIDLVKANSRITNEDYLEKIAAVACGNPRLAMMAATVAEREGRLSSLSNLGRLFDSFYAGLKKNNTSKEDEFLYKALTIAAILGPFMMDSAQLTPLCSTFNISLEDFQNAIDKWVELEYIDRYSNNYYKISEQNMGPYMFYSYVIRKQPELIEQIFDICFGKQDSTLHEDIITCSYLFGLSSIRKSISTYLSKFFNTLHNKTDKIIFLNQYWPLIIDDTMGFIATEVLSTRLSDVVTIEYKFDYEINEFAYTSNRDSLLDLMYELFDYSIEESGTVMQLALEYIRRKPKLAPQLTWSINERFGIKRDDYRNGFIRQTVLLDAISKGMNDGDLLSKSIFWRIIPTLLKCENNYSSGIFRDPQKIKIYTLSVRENKTLSELHKRVWSLIDLHFDRECFCNFIEKHEFYAPKGSKFPKLDASLAGELIEKYLSPRIFDDCIIVHDISNRIQLIHSCKTIASSLKYKFNNKSHQFYSLLRWDYCNGKEEASYDYKKYNFLKTKELKSSFNIKTLKECNTFIRKFRWLLKSNRLDNKEAIYSSVSFLIGCTLQQNIDLGKYFFQQTLRSITDYFDISPIMLPFVLDVKHKWTDVFSVIKKILQTTKSQHKLKLLINFYKLLPAKYLVADDLRILLKCINNYNSTEKLYIAPSQFTKFNLVERNSFTSIMRKIYHANQIEFKYHLGSFEVEDWLSFITDTNLAEQLYLQQAIFQDHFDFKRKAFLNIVKNRPHFLVDYVRLAKPRHSPKMNEVWSIDNIEPTIEEIMSMVHPDFFSQGISQDWEFEIFSDIKNDDNAKRAENFIISRFNQNKNIEQTFRLARIFSRQLFNRLAVEYIDIADSAEKYMTIDWINASPFITAINQTTGEIIAQRWQSFLAIINTSSSVKKLPIVAQIKLLIHSANESSRREAEREKLFK